MYLYTMLIIINIFNDIIDIGNRFLYGFIEKIPFIFIKIFIMVRLFVRNLLYRKKKIKES